MTNEDTSQRDILLTIFALFVIILVIYNIYLGFTVKKIGIPGIFELEFGAPIPTPNPTPTPKTGFISVHSTPDGANIYLDGINVGTTPQEISTEVGSHVIKLELKEYQDWSQNIQVAAGLTSSVSVSLLKLTLMVTPNVTPIYTTGFISVHSTPDGANIYLDGINVGTTPQEISTEVGSHVIKLELKGYQDWSQNIQVAAGLTSKVVSKLQPAVYSTGNVALRSSETLDLDGGIIGIESNSDIWFHSVSKYERYIEPLRYVSITRVGMSPLGRDGCMSESYTIPRIPLETLKVGTYMCVFTDEYRYSEVRIDSVYSPGGWLNISFTTWELTN